MTTPPGGILDWGTPAAIFPDRQSAREAINRTEHYRLAFGLVPGAAGSLPEKQFCKVIPALMVAS